jgi:3'-5' exoribonuclease
MLNQKEITQLAKNDSVDHYLLVRKADIRLTKSNKEFLSLELGDTSGSMTSNVWDNINSIFSNIKSGEVVKVKGSIEEFQGNLQIRISSIKIVNEKEGISPSDFLPHSKRNIAVMKKEFEDRLNKISNEYLKSLLKLIFTEEKFEKYSKVPAGKSWHHSYVHGLLEHTLEIIRICDLMCDIHPEINRDLLISGAMMHDFGKTEELNFEKNFDYTDKGKLLGHIVISAMLVNEKTKEIKGFPEDLKNLLIHIILSHQGKLEYASPVVPKTLEAITLYQADELSAKVNAYKNALISDSRGESKWTKYISLISTELFNHGLTPEAEDEINKTLFD